MSQWIVAEYDHLLCMAKSLKAHLNYTKYSYS